MARLALAIAGKHPFDAAPFWAAIADWKDARLIAVILAHDGSVPVAAPASPEITQLVLPGANLFTLWGAAIACAQDLSAEYVAILHVDAPPTPGWLATMLAAIEEGGDAYHGPVEARYAPGDRRMIGYLSEYVQFYPPIASGMEEIAGNNLVIRCALAGTTVQLRRDGFSKTGLLQARRAAGSQAAVQVGDAAVVHQRRFDLRSYIVRRYRHGRCYAADRVAGRGVLTRIAFAAATPLLPALRTVRIGRHAARHSQFARAFLRHLPAILAAETGWSVGEALGYLAGEGGCRARLD